LKYKKSETSQFRIKSLQKNSAFASHSRVKSSKLIDIVTAKKKTEDKLEVKLLNKLKNINPTENFEIFEETFQMVIRNDKNYGKILEKIKEAYDQKIGYFSVKNFENLLAQVKELKEKYLEENSRKIELKKEFERVVNENLELSRNLDMTESLYLEVHDKLQKMMNLDLNDLELNENTWKVIVHDNKKLKKKVEILKNENDELNQQVKYCFKVFSDIKENGNFNKNFNFAEVFKGKMCKIENAIESDSCDSEDLVCDKVKLVKKPSSVPVLDFQQLAAEEENEKDSDESDDFD
jgi:hypothetical protein